MNAPGAVKGSRQELSFIVSSIDCITCFPVFRLRLKKVPGVLEVKELPITNKIIVGYDSSVITKKQLQELVNEIADKAGFGGKVIFPIR